MTYARQAMQSDNSWRTARCSRPVARAQPASPIAPWPGRKRSCGIQAPASWTLMAAEAVIRVYHGVSLLLPDGRVFSAGSGDGQRLPRQTNGQILQSALSLQCRRLARDASADHGVSATQVHYGASRSRSPPPDAASISRVHLIRFSAVTACLQPEPDALPRRLFRQRRHAECGGSSQRSGRAPPGPFILESLHRGRHHSVTVRAVRSVPARRRQRREACDGWQDRGACRSARRAERQPGCRPGREGRSAGFRP